MAFGGILKHKDDAEPPRAAPIRREEPEERPPGKTPRWSDASLVDGPEVGGREAALAALRAWRDTRSVPADAVLEIVTHANAVVAWRVVRSSGDSEFDRLALALYARGDEDRMAMPEPSSSSGERVAFLVTAFGTPDRSTPDEADWR